MNKTPPRQAFAGVSSKLAEERGEEKKKKPPAVGIR